MKKYTVSLTFIIISVLFYNQNALAQYTTKSKKAIKAYEKSLNLLKFRKFDEAVEELLKAVKADDNFAEAHYRLAATYQLFRENEESMKYYRKVTEVAPDNPKFKGAFYRLSQHYMALGQYKEAKSYGEKFLSLKPKQRKFVDKTKKVIADCKYAQKGMQNPLDFKPKDLPAPLNQFYLQYFPAVTGDQKNLIFTARNKPPRNSKDSDENLYISSLESNAWSVPEPISDNINSPYNEGTASISADGKTLVFTSCDRGGERVNYGQCDLYISTKSGGVWSKPKNLGKKVNSPSWESQPTLSADGKTLYFISTRAGGKGGKDIWVSTLDKDGEWTEATNLEEINTKFEEASPFIHPNGKTLFFSSDGYPSYGGLDLYKTEIINKQWTEPQNLGYPINDFENQLGLVISADNTKGYYSVDNIINGVYTSSTMKSFEVPDEIKPKYQSNFVKGYVYDTKTNEKLEAFIELFDLSENESQARVSSDIKDGRYLIVLNQGSEYALEVRKKGYAFKSLAFNYTEGKDLKPLEINIGLDPITKGTVFRLNNIFFDYNKFELKEKSKRELDELVKFMEENAKVRGEISGHTDNIGNAQANKELSLKRAKSVYDYLVKAGIAVERLSYQGYGSSKPSANNNTDEGRARNRRIEFEIK